MGLFSPTEKDLLAAYRRYYGTYLAKNQCDQWENSSPNAAAVVVALRCTSSVACSSSVACMRQQRLPMEKQKRDEKLNTLEGDPINREERSKEGEERERGGAAACAAFAVRPEEQRRKQAQQQRTNQTSTENEPNKHRERTCCGNWKASNRKEERVSFWDVAVFVSSLAVCFLAGLAAQTNYEVCVVDENS